MQAPIQNVQVLPERLTHGNALRYPAGFVGAGVAKPHLAVELYLRQAARFKGEMRFSRTWSLPCSTDRDHAKEEITICPQPRPQHRRFRLILT